LKFNWLAILAVVIGIAGCRETGAVTLDGNSYNVVVAISDDVKTVSDVQRAAFLQTVKDTFTKASRLLFDATDHYVYFGNVDILLPRSWNNLPGISPTMSATYVNADVRIEETLQDDEMTLVRSPRTQQSKPCGQPGEYIIVPPQFFLNADQSTTKEFGDPAKVLIHEWAHYRYGVFEEYGFTSEQYPDDTFPYSFVNTKGQSQITGCNDTEIAGSTSDYFGDSCSVADSGCLFKADVDSPIGPTSSLMNMQFLPTVTRFCDGSNHDPTAPNKHNYWCRNRSVLAVIKKNADMVGLNALPAEMVTDPQFKYVKPTSPSVYVVVDVATHDHIDKAVFNQTKEQLKQLVTNLSGIGQNTVVGIGTMAGTTTTSHLNGDSRLGGYINYIQEPILLKGRESAVKAKVDSLEQKGDGLLVEQALLDVGDLLTPFTYQSGSIVLLIKLNSMTAAADMDTEWQAAQLLNSRNARLVTVEFGSSDCQRVSLITEGSFFNCDSSNYEDQLKKAREAVVEMATHTSFQNHRLNLDRNLLTSTAIRPGTGFRTVDWKESSIEINFYIPVDAGTGYDIKLRDPEGKTYTMSSPEHQQIYVSWNGQFKIHTFTASGGRTGDWTYEVSCTSDTLQSQVDAVEILPLSIPITIGGGGRPTSKLIEIEVFTSGSSGVLDMGAIPEDNSFLMYASLRKGIAVGTSASRVTAIIHGANGKILSAVPLKDDGKYPDNLRRDGIYSGYYKPDGVSGTNKYRVSIQALGYRKQNPSIDVAQDPYSYALPVDQSSEYCCGSEYTGSTSAAIFQRYLPFVVSVDVKGANYYQDKPMRIMDFQIDDIADDDSKVTLSWTAPSASCSNQQSQVSSYRLVYSDVVSDIISEMGIIPRAKIAVDSSDVLAGSLTPLAPGSQQSVTIRLNRTHLYNPLYFTISSLMDNIQSYPAPMKFVPRREGYQPETTTEMTSSPTVPTTPTTPTAPTSSTEVTTRETTTPSDHSPTPESSTTDSSTASTPPSSSESSTSPTMSTTPSAAVGVSAAMKWLLTLALAVLFV